MLTERIEREALADRTAVLMSVADVDLPSVGERLEEFDAAIAAPFHVVLSEKAELMRELGLRAS